MPDKYDQLEKIKKLRDEGALTEEEFEQEKAKIMAEPTPAVAPASGMDGREPRPWGMELNAFCMLLHLSQFAGFVVPFAGWVLPIVMWATCKDEAVEVDVHGRIVINWMISSLIYALVSAVLILLVVGIFFLMALFVCSIIFTIIGAVRANSGEAWKYPLSIHFLGVDHLIEGAGHGAGATV